MQRYNEKSFEDLIEKHLLQSAYIKRNPKDYNKALCLDTNLLWKFLQTTQPEQIEDLQKRSKDLQKSFFERLKSQIEKEGLLEILKKGVEVLGVSFKLAYDKPPNQKNPDNWKNYQSNLFSVVRQLHYSTKNNNSLDMVIFLNGLPLFSFELKNKLSGQSVVDAIEQYKKNRSPHEILFKHHTLAHFALDNDLVYMSTKLEGDKTRFTPFNRGLNDGSGELDRECGAGNPATSGIKTAYLWEEILQKDSLLHLILQMIKPGGKSGAVIFARYHQLDVVRKLCQIVQKEGVGGRYLIQHSAGSGKSNSIAWLACALVGLSEQEKVIFDSVLVITDRIILDRQLQNTIEAFCSIKGVVEAITKGNRQLKEAISEGKKIIISTIQKFPYILEDIPSMRDKKFAIIIDEAHSSQGGKYAQDLAKTTGKDQENQQEDLETFLNKAIQAKKFQPNASYFAFSATPKPETLELFGTQTSQGKFIPFHLYSMKQAIEEGFILDVLACYISYKDFAKVVSTILSNPHYEKNLALKKLKRYIRDHPKSIQAKTEVMLNHFYSCVHTQIKGRAKAMVITDSRKSALEYFKAFQAQLKQEGYPHKALVAFSGEINLEGETYSEASLNHMPETQTPKAFERDDYRFLIVADKYQTGFDQPLLHTMYVDKALSAVACVQTLSRLNRTHPDKTNTCILDFVNNAQEIIKAFEPYYKQSSLEGPSDLNKLFDLKTHLNNYGVYTQEEVENFNLALFKEALLSQIHAMLDVMIRRYSALEQDLQQEFYSKAKAYIKGYKFWVQILPFTDIFLEKLFRLLVTLIKKLPRDKNPEDITKVVALEEYRLEKEQEAKLTLTGQAELKPFQAEGRKAPQTQLEKLSEILDVFHREYGITLNENEIQAKAKILKNALDNIYSDLTFLENFRRTDLQNRRILFENKFEEQLPYLADIDPQLCERILNDKNFISQDLLKNFEKGLENLGVD
ncbi:type I restriction endonuclease subunit R [Helicobacter suis]|uniref:type I restriction endonuclease subunit R n=1 Tax=Helicobacter suis TaxID=104628 RepID=UPI0013D1C6DB|nr:type I restriction endonuclease [Helicobacter suis]